MVLLAKLGLLEISMLTESEPPFKNKVALVVAVTVAPPLISRENPPDGGNGGVGRPPPPPPLPLPLLVEELKVVPETWAVVELLPAVS